MIPWTRKMQCRQLGRKKFEQRLIILRSMSKNDGKKIFGQKSFHHKLVHLTSRKQYWQLDRQISVEMAGKSRWMPNDEKKELFRKKFSAKYPLGNVVSRIDKASDCFSTEKKPFFLRLISINRWKNKQKLCQNKDMSSKWSCGVVECSFVNLIERASKKIEQFLLNVRKWWEKNIFDRKNFYHKMLQRTDRQQFWRHRREVFVGKPRTNSLKFQWWAKKESFRKKISSTDLLDKW